MKFYEVKPIVKLKRKKKFKRYQRPIPGDRVQIDTCKIMPSIYQYTAVDDCTRFRVLEIYKRRTANNTEVNDKYKCSVTFSNIKSILSIINSNI